jgi:hypothetical protein
MAILGALRAPRDTVNQPGPLRGFTGQGGLAGS